MAEFETPPTFPGVQYTAGKMDIGSGYAAGIAQAGEGIAKGVGAAFDVMNRRQNATDMLNTLHTAGVLDDEKYNAIAGKSLGAQEQMLGMFTNQWILDQANQRQMALQRGQGGVETAVNYHKLLDLINLTRSPTGVPGKAQWAGPQQQTTQQQAAPQPGQPVTNTQVGASQQTAWQYGGPQPQPQTMQPAQATQPNVQQPARPVASPRLPGSKRVMDTDSGRKGWQYPSGQTVWD